VLGGYVLDAASADEARRILTNVPLPQRMLMRLFAKRTFARYRSKLYVAVP
jgi:hypothetical protein